MCWWHNHSGYLGINDSQNTKEHGFTYLNGVYCAGMGGKKTTAEKSGAMIGGTSSVQCCCSYSWYPSSSPHSHPQVF